jgi:trigger factor
MPPMDEAFAQSLNVESVKELRTRITENLGRAKANMVREVMIEQAMDQLLQRSKVEVSDNSWEAIADRRLSETAAEQEQQGKTMAEYAKENGMSLEELVQAWKDKANLYIKRAFLIREVFTAEKMELSNEDLNVELYAMAEEYRVEPKEMASMLSKNNALEELRFRAISRKVSDFLLEHSEVAKPTAKKTKK